MWRKSIIVGKFFPKIRKSEKWKLHQFITNYVSPTVLFIERKKNHVGEVGFF